MWTAIVNAKSTKQRELSIIMGTLLLLFCMCWLAQTRCDAMRYPLTKNSIVALAGRLNYNTVEFKYKFKIRTTNLLADKLPLADAYDHCCDRGLVPLLRHHSPKNYCTPTANDESFSIDRRGSTSIGRWRCQCWLGHFRMCQPWRFQWTMRQSIIAWTCC